jgi:acyl carrier protein phosphodiesterase
MNYLAHLFLSEHNYDSIVGNFIADFVKGNVPPDLPDKIRTGIVLHRNIDQFTDDHPIVKKAKYTIDARYGRFRGIMLDIFYDHFLASNFSKYSGQSLEDFSSLVFHSLIHNWQYLPEQVKVMTPNMIKNNWLTGYRNISNIGKALKHIEMRSKKSPDMSSAIEELSDKIEILEESFFLFFPDLIKYADDLKLDFKPNKII